MLGRLERLDVNICFSAGSAELDTSALVTIGKVAAIVDNDEKKGRRVVLAAFSDDANDRASDAALSKKRADAAVRELQAQGVRVERTFGFARTAPRPRGRDLLPSGKRECTAVFLTR